MPLGRNLFEPFGFAFKILRRVPLLFLFTHYGAALITKVNSFVLVAPLASSASTVNVELPAVVGVPESTPALLRVKPTGKVPLERVQVYGDWPPLTARVSE